MVLKPNALLLVKDCQTNGFDFLNSFNSTNKLLNRHSRAFQCLHHLVVEVFLAYEVVRKVIRVNHYLTCRSRHIHPVVLPNKVGIAMFCHEVLNHAAATTTHYHVGIKVDNLLCKQVARIIQEYQSLHECYGQIPARHFETIHKSIEQAYWASASTYSSMQSWKRTLWCVYLDLFYMPYLSGLFTTKIQKMIVIKKIRG